MLTDKQLNSIGFRWVTDNLELLTPYGKELAKHPHWYSPDELNELHGDQENVRLFIRLIRDLPDEINALSRLLMPFKDIRRSLRNCGEAALTEVELFEIKRFLMQLTLIAPVANSLTLNCNCSLAITAMPQALLTIDPDGAKSPTFYVSDSFSDRLSSIRAMRKSLDLKIRVERDPEKLEQLLLDRTRLSADEENETASIRYSISMALASFVTEMLSNIAAIGRIDYALSRARLAVTYSAIIPVICNETVFELQDMLNPMVAELLQRNGKGFTPVSIKLALGATVITGANMGGKSIALKTLALNCALAMCGLPVFARSASLPLPGDIFMLSDDSEDTRKGLSSFGGEMCGFNQILDESHSTSNSLVLLDEFARGTNPHEGAALVKAAVICFNKRVSAAKGAVYAVIATHFDGVARLAKSHYQVAGLRNVDRAALNAMVRSGGGNVVNTLEGFMDYGLYPVSPYEEPPRDAVAICRALNVSDEFLELVEL